MKKLMHALVAPLLLSVAFAAAAQVPQPPEIAARSFMVYEGLR